MSARPQLWLAVVAATVITAGCGQHASQPTAPTPPAASDAPVVVPTEGSTPSTDGMTPAAEPQEGGLTGEVPGQVVAVGQAPEGVVVDDVTRRVAVATRNPNQIVLLNADGGAIVGRIAMPGVVRHLELAAPGGPLLVPVESTGALVRVDLTRANAAPPIPTGAGAHDATTAGNGVTFVSDETAGTVAVVSGDRLVKVFANSVQPAGLVAVDRSVGMVDVRANTLTVYDAATLHVLGVAPAGAGPTHLVADRHGRMVATDTRGDAVRVFTPLPAPREIGVVAQPGGPYGIAYDRNRDRLWVASSGRNEVVGYDMSDATPREVQRLPTVQNPYTLGVDASTGRLFIGGVAGGVLQILDGGP